MNTTIDTKSKRIRLCKAHSLFTHTFFLLGYSLQPFQLLGSVFQLCGDSGKLFGFGLQLFFCGRKLLRQDPFLVLQVQRVGFSKVSLTPGPLGVFLQKFHRLLELSVFFGEGFHPLYQLMTVLDSPSYTLKINNDSNGI